MPSSARPNTTAVTPSSRPTAVTHRELHHNIGTMRLTLCAPTFWLVKVSEP